MRPGEKLYEELSTLLEDTAPTSHEKIRIFVGNAMPEGDMVDWLNYLREICQSRDAGRLVVALKEIVIDYSPSANLLKRVIETRDPQTASLAALIRATGVRESHADHSLGEKRSVDLLAFEKGVGNR